MRRAPLTIALALAIGATAAAWQIPFHHASQAPAAKPLGGSWQLVEYYRGDAFVIDHALTHDDCDDAQAKLHARGIRFVCELEN
jgi:hypothetical protein